MNLNEEEEEEYRYRGVLIRRGYSAHNILTKTALYQNKHDAEAAACRLMEKLKEHHPTRYAIERLIKRCGSWS